MGTQAGAARRHRRRPVRVVDVAAAPLRRPRQPVADHRLRAPRPHRRAGRAVQAEGRRSCSRSSPTSTRPTPPTTRSSRGIERYWTLRYLQQNGIHELDAAVMKDGLVRADTLPLVFRAVGAEQLPRGAQRARAHRRDRPADARRARAASSRASTPAPRRQRRAEDAAATTTTSESAGPLAHRRSTSRRRAKRRPSADRDRRRACVRLALPTRFSHAADRAAASRSPSHGALLGGALRRPGGLQPHVRGHAARGRSWSTRAPARRRRRRRRSRRRAWPAAARPTKGRATSPLPPSALTEVGDADEETQQADRAAAADAAAAAGAGAARARAAAADRPAARPGRPDGARAGRAAPPAASSCSPRSRSASTRRTRGRRSATSARRRARRSTRSTTTSCAARSRTAARATSPRTRASKLYGELTMNVTVDADGRVLETEVVRGSGNKVLDRRAVAIVARRRAVRPLHAGDAAAGRPARRSPRASASRARTASRRR